MNRNPLAGGLEVTLREGFDHVTGLQNRQFLNDSLTRIWTSAEEVQPLSLVLLDIDHFMGFNRAYGPIDGDDCLCTIANVVQTLAPRGAITARMDADEFAILLPQVSPAIARSIGSNLIASIAGMQIPNSRSHMGVVTASAGAATAESNYDFMWGPQTLMANAREALDHARIAGGNRLDVHGAAAIADPFANAVVTERSVA